MTHNRIVERCRRAGLPGIGSNPELTFSYSRDYRYPRRTAGWVHRAGVFYARDGGWGEWKAKQRRRIAAAGKREIDKVQNTGNGKT